MWRGAGRGDGLPGGEPREDGAGGVRARGVRHQPVLLAGRLQAAVRIRRHHRARVPGARATF
eukprot:9064888-Pyramimonas_sp.AAC.1